jgi:hypothetical protein
VLKQGTPVRSPCRRAEGFQSQHVLEGETRVPVTTPFLAGSVVMCSNAYGASLVAACVLWLMPARAVGFKSPSDTMVHLHFRRNTLPIARGAHHGAPHLHHIRLARVVPRCDYRPACSTPKVQRSDVGF